MDNEARVEIDLHAYEKMLRLGLGIMVEFGEETLTIIVTAREGKPFVRITTSPEESSNGQ
jgi:hypothetical protein